VVAALCLGATALLAVLLTSCASDPEAAPSREDRAAALFERIGDDDPFCTAAVLRGDEIVFADAWGSDDDGPVDTDTEVDIASTSKQFTGVAVELLIDQGLLDGDELVGDLVPEAGPTAADVTVEELLVHTSGLIDYTELLDADDDEPTTQADAVDAIAASAPSGARGAFDYSNSNYVLLAEVVEAVDGRTLPELLDDDVFEPLDLAMALDPRSTWAQIGDGSVWTTPTELVTWSRQYWDQTLDGPELTEAMFDPEVPTDEDEASDERYGSGILRDTDDEGTEVLFHDGSWDGYETDWMVIPSEELAAAVTCDERAELTDDDTAEALLDLWRDS
jgi:CubicO group peptidase (beta-lactamase class C family)